MSTSTMSGAGGEGDFVLLGIPDVNGAIRGKALRPAAFEAALRNGTAVTNLLLALDPTDVPITDYESFGIRAGAGDILVRPEPETLRELSWRPGWRICLATPYWPDGSSVAFASREVLQRTIASMAALDLDVLAAFEYEIRIFDDAGRPLSDGISYSVAEVLRFDEFMARLRPALDSLGIELSAAHTEAGPGLVELNVAARRGLAAADDAALLKFAVKEVAASLGLRASFLAKTAVGEEGSSGHIHLSCWNGDDNAFADEATLDAAVAGVLAHLPAASLLLNPTINSYKRLVPGYFAPVNVSWGIENRSAAVRAIRSERSDLTRLECRRPGADANPYLALAAVIASAAAGVQHGLKPPPPITGDAAEQDELPTLPHSLESALHAFQVDEDFRKALGPEFSEYYTVSRAWELKAWQGSVTDWERQRYGSAV